MKVTIKDKEVELPKPLGAKLLVERLQEEKVEKSTIIIPDEFKLRTLTGHTRCKVLAIGSAAFKAERFIYVYGDYGKDTPKVGDIVTIKPYSGINAIEGNSIDECKYQYISDESIEGIFK